METRFEFKDFTKVFSLNILLYAIFVLAFQYIPGSKGILDSLHPTVSFLIQYIVQFIVLFFPLWYFVVDKYAANLSDFGFEKISFKKLIKTVLSSYVFYIILTAIIASVLFQNHLEVPGYKGQDSYIPIFGTDAFGFTAAVTFIIIVAPFLEELFFRGFIYRVFTKQWPVWLGSTLTALIFALIHFQVNSIIPLFLLGLILNYNYQKTGSVWTSVAFHSMNNAIAFSLDIYLFYHPELLDQLELVSGFHIM